MKTVSTNKAPAAIGPYSQAQIVGGMVYTSGQIGIDPATGIVPEGVEAQAHQVFKNLTELLKAAGSDMSKVVKTTVFIKDMNDFGLVNGIYAEYFTEPYPARSCVEVARLPEIATQILISPFSTAALSRLATMCSSDRIAACLRLCTLFSVMSAIFAQDLTAAHMIWSTQSR